MPRARPRARQRTAFTCSTSSRDGRAPTVTSSSRQSCRCRTEFITVRNSACHLHAPVQQDRPDLIESELSGLAFDSLQQIFKTELIQTMFDQPPPPQCINEDIHLFIDPAAGGPQSDYAVLSITRHKGLVTVIPRAHRRPVDPLARRALVCRRPPPCLLARRI